MLTIKAELKIIGVNPFVSVPEEILNEIFKQAGKSKGQIPICGSLNDKPFKQTLVRFSGAWRLYINTSMLKNSPRRVGEILEIFVEFDPSDRSIKPHPEFIRRLNDNDEAKAVFERLSASRQHEIVRYLAFLKTEESLERNIVKAIEFLLGRARFVGREKP